jgi:hypothetical protein
MTDESRSVRGINIDVRVSSFRITSVGDATKSDIAQCTSKLEGQLPQEEDAGIQQSESTKSQAVASVPGGRRTQRFNKSLKFRQGEPMKKIVHTAQEYTQMQWKRDERKKAVMELRPPSSYSDLADLEAIEIAKNTIGDYKLKDGPTFIAPEEERINAMKKRRQLIAIQNAIPEMKLTFNARVQNLMHLKGELKVSIDETNRRLAEITLTIGADPAKEGEVRVARDETITPLDLRERIDVTIPTPEAISFAEQVAAAARRRLEAQTGKAKAQATRRGAAVHKRMTVTPQKKKPEEKEKSSELELIERNQVRVQLEFKRKTLLQNIQQAITKFDEIVTELAEEKVQIHSEIILAELRFLIMLREFKLLAKLERKYHELNEKLMQHRGDMDAIDTEVAVPQRRLKDAEHNLEDSQK